MVVFNNLPVLIAVLALTPTPGPTPVRVRSHGPPPLVLTSGIPIPTTISTCAKNVGWAHHYTPLFVGGFGERDFSEKGANFLPKIEIHPTRILMVRFLNDGVRLYQDRMVPEINLAQHLPLLVFSVTSGNLRSFWASL